MKYSDETQSRESLPSEDPLSSEWRAALASTVVVVVRIYEEEFDLRLLENMMHCATFNGTFLIIPLLSFPSN